MFPRFRARFELDFSRYRSEELWSSASEQPQRPVLNCQALESGVWQLALRASLHGFLEVSDTLRKIRVELSRRKSCLWRRHEGMLLLCSRLDLSSTPCSMSSSNSFFYLDVRSFHTHRFTVIVATAPRPARRRIAREFVGGSSRQP